MLYTDWRRLDPHLTDRLPVDMRGARQRRLRLGRQLVMHGGHRGDQPGFRSQERVRSSGQRGQEGGERQAHVLDVLDTVCEAIAQSVRSSWTVTGAAHAQDGRAIDCTHDRGRAHARMLSRQRTPYMHQHSCGYLRSSCTAFGQ